MLDTLRRRRDEVYAIARRHKAERLWVFGSVARKEESSESDIDLLAKCASDTSLFDIIRMERELSSLFGRNVEVVSSAVLPQEVRFANRVCREAVAL